MSVSDPGTDIRHSSWLEELEVSCVWLPQLPLRVELLRHPAWDGRPLVLGAGPGERRVVQLCSPEAGKPESLCPWNCLEAKALRYGKCPARSIVTISR